MEQYPDEVQLMLKTGNFAEARSTFEKIIFSRHANGQTNGLLELIEQCERMQPISAVPATKRASDVTPCPAISDITMIQTTIWDNWAGAVKRPDTPKGLKKNPWPLHRYGCGVRVWTIDPATIRTMGQLDRSAAFAGSTRLYPSSAMSIVATELVRHDKIDPAYCAELQTTIAASTEACRFGLLSGDGSLTKRIGKGYIPNQFVRIELFEHQGELSEPDFCDLHIGGETLRIAGWTQFHPTKTGAEKKSIREFSGSKGQFPVFTSRLDLRGAYRFFNWHSGDRIV